MDAKAAGNSRTVKATLSQVDLSERKHALRGLKELLNLSVRDDRFR